jgi:hypothetical protein
MAQAVQLFRGRVDIRSGARSIQAACETGFPSRVDYQRLHDVKRSPGICTEAGCRELASKAKSQLQHNIAIELQWTLITCYLGSFRLLLVADYW